MTSILRTTTIRAICASAAVAMLAILTFGCSTQTPETVPTTAAAPTESQTDETQSSQVSEATSLAEPTPEYPDPAMTRLEAVVLPCIPWPGSSVDPCERRDSWEDNTPTIDQDYEFPEIASTFEENLIRQAKFPKSFAMFAVRATVIPGSTRCGWTEDDREHISDHLSEDTRVTRYRKSYCYYDIAVNEYLHGDGPARLTVMSTRNPYSCEGNEDVECLIKGAQYLEKSTRYEGVEWIIFLMGPPWGLGTTTWHIRGFYDVQRNEEDEVVVVRPFKDIILYISSPENYELNLSRLEWTLDDFRGVVADAYRTLKKGKAGHIGSTDDRLTQFVAEDAGPTGFNEYMERSRMRNWLNITPSPPPPVPGEGDPDPSGLTTNDIIATRVAGGVTDSNLTATPESVQPLSPDASNSP